MDRYKWLAVEKASKRLWKAFNVLNGLESQVAHRAPGAREPLDDEIPVVGKKVTEPRSLFSAQWLPAAGHNSTRAPNNILLGRPAGHASGHVRRPRAPLSGGQVALASGLRAP